MIPEPAPAAVISGRFVQLFVADATTEVGAENLPVILGAAGLSPDEIQAGALGEADGLQVAGVYAAFQQALRVFYGRGARGTLIRIGRGMWDQVITQATFMEKAELEITRRLPIPARRRRLLDFVAGYLGAGGSIKVHLLDLDLLLADHASATAWRQSSDRPICFVTLGLIQGALFWATRQEADVEEIACMSAGAPACEFRITFGGQ